MTNLTPSTLRLLCAFISEQAPIPPGSLDDYGADLAPSWPEIVQLARQHGLAPMLLWALEKAGVDVGGHAQWEPLTLAARKTAVHFLLATSTQAKVHTSLAAAGIPAIWLKGIALARTVYPQPSLRPMGDIDLLIPYAQREEALKIAQSLGYRATKPTLLGSFEEPMWHYHLQGNVAGSIRLELHFRLLGYADKLLPRPHLQWFWEQTEPWSDGDVVLTHLRPEAHLLYLCAHAILQHGEADFRLLRYLDLHQLITQSPALDWRLVVGQARVLGWTYAVERALSLAQTYYATPLPVGLLAELQRQRPAHENVAYATRRQSAGSRLQSVLATLAAMSWPARLRLALGLIVPPTAYMRWRYSIDSGWKLPFYYAYRWFDIAGDMVRTLGKRITRN